MMCGGLPESAVANLRAIFSDYPEIDRVVLYGSRALGSCRTGSDIDLTIEAETMDLSELLTIENRIDDLLLPWKVDLSLRHKIDNPDLLAHIDRVGVTFYPVQS
jgi:predicted nucleotidyltransferase